MAESSHAHYNWNEYIDLCERLVARVGMSGWQFDCVLCLARGGMRPGDFFSRIYNKPLAVLSTSSYREAAGTVQGELDIARYITGVSDLQGKLLLVDDLCDSGMTIRQGGRAPEAQLPEDHRNPRGRDLDQGLLGLQARLLRRALQRQPPGFTSPFECYDDLGIENHIANCRKKFGDAI